LFKRRKDSKEWQKRFFICDEQQIIYSSPDSNAPLGNIHLSKILAVRAFEETGSSQDDCSFQIDTMDRVFFLRAANKQERDGWVECLQELMKAIARVSVKHDRVTSLAVS
jgi:hypothetical protein